MYNDLPSAKLYLKSGAVYFFNFNAYEEADLLSFYLL